MFPEVQSEEDIMIVYTTEWRGRPFSLNTQVEHQNY